MTEQLARLAALALAGQKKNKFNIINKIKHFPGLSSDELHDKTLRKMRAEQLIRIRRIQNWSKSTDEMLRVTITEQIDIANIWNSVGNDLQNSLQGVLNECQEETRKKITEEIAKRIIAEYQEQDSEKSLSFAG